MLREKSRQIKFTTDTKIHGFRELCEFVILVEP